MKVILSAKAIRQLEALLDYLATEFSPKTRRDFQKRLNRFVQVIKKMPNAFPSSKIFAGCRKCVVSTQTSIYYRVKTGIIEIISIQDNRQQL